MRVDAFLADSAEVNQNKLYVLGAGWNTIFVRSFPAVHRHLAVCATVHVPFTATNTSHKLQLELLTQDGASHPIGYRVGESGQPEPVQAMGGEFTLGRPPTLVDGDEQVACFSFAVDGMRLEEPGKFEWLLTIDGDEVARLPMRVQQHRG